MSPSSRISAIMLVTTKNSRESYGSRLYSGMGSGFYFLYSVRQDVPVDNRQNQLYNWT